MCKLIENSKGVELMPNYEELYYIARNNYNRAIENRDAIRKNASELQGKKTTLTRELGEKQSALVAIQQKKLLVQEAFDKCKHILENEFPTMKKDLQTTSDEYKKIISSDTGVADLSSIYSTDISSTNSNLDAVITELQARIKELEGQEATAQTAVTNCSNELTSVTTQLNNVGSESSAQRQVNAYYTEMKEYELKWQNGE